MTCSHIYSKVLDEYIDFPGCNLNIDSSNASASLIQCGTRRTLSPIVDEGFSHLSNHSRLFLPL